MAEHAPIIPVILSGGSGSRLWPESRPERPKQLLALTGEETMLQLTMRRIAAAGFLPPIIVASLSHADMIEDQLQQMGVTAQALVLEPVARNTAPAIALAALAAGAGPNPLLVMPSDHVIADNEAFHSAIESALPFAREGWLTTFGVTPDKPETGYGYIKIGSPLTAGVHQVDRFVEKPSKEKAAAMLAAGDHVWNAGIFLFRADSYLDALGEHAPEMQASARDAIAIGTRRGDRIFPDSASFAASPSESIDYAVMEQASRVAVVPVEMGWSDVGTWDALHAVRQPDAEGNVLSGDVIALDAQNCLVKVGAGRRVALVGVTDLIVVASGDDVLVLPRGRSQDVRKIVEMLSLSQS